LATLAGMTLHDKKCTFAAKIHNTGKETLLSYLCEKLTIKNISILVLWTDKLLHFINLNK